jgi:hypothetical protein
MWVSSNAAAPSELRQRQMVPELPAGADAELGEHLVQVIFRGPEASEQLGTNLRVRVALGSQPGDLRLLHGKDVTRVYGVFGYCLACCLELPAGPLGEGHGPEPAEHVMGGPQVLARFRPPLPAAQPFAVHQVSASEMDGHAAPTETVDRLPVEGIRSRAVAEQRA